METNIMEVKSQGQVLGKVEIPKYESVQEALDAIGETKILDYINVQLGTRIKNEYRTEHGPSRGSEKDLSRLLMNASQETFLEIQQECQRILTIDDKDEKSEAIVELCDRHKLETV